MKRLLALSLALIMLLSLGACKKDTDDEEKESTTVPAETLPVESGRQEEDKVPDAEDVFVEDPTVDMPDSVDEITQAQQEFQQLQNMEIKKNKGVDNILIIGSDRRDSSENGRADTVILLTLNYNTGKVHQTSFMRAMYVCIPRPEGEVWGMLNAAFSWGGAELLVDTIELNFRVEIDHYLVIDFETLEKAVDLVGGIEIELTEEEAEYVFSDDPAKAHAGKATLNGEKALRYARLRQIDNDFKRTQRQRKVIDCLIAKLGSADTGVMMQLAFGILPMIGTDFKDSTALVTYVANAIPYMSAVTDGMMLPIENQSGETYIGMIYVDGQEMYKFDFEENVQALHAYINS